MLAYTTIGTMRPKRNMLIFVTMGIITIVTITNIINKEEVLSKPTVKQFSCISNIPCQYENDVDFRIIVLAYDRHKSLEKCLSHLQNLTLDGATAQVEIWLDRAKDGSVNNLTLEVARQFEWKLGVSRVNVQHEHVGVVGQWIYTWRPKKYTNEIALILEDDTDVSPFVYRWLKAVRNHFAWRSDISGYSLQDYELAIDYENNHYIYLNIPKDIPVYLWRRHTNWGFSPHPEQWCNFQDWYHKVKQNTSFQPYVPQDKLLTESWITNIRKDLLGRIWSYWFVHYTDRNYLWSVNSNLRNFTMFEKGTYNPTNFIQWKGTQNGSLAFNRQEPGLNHAPNKHNIIVSSRGQLITNWDFSFIDWPKKIDKFDNDERKIVSIKNAMNFGI